MNFIRTRVINGTHYMITLRQVGFNSYGHIPYFVQTWKMNISGTSGVLHMPYIKGWSKPSDQGYKLKSWDIENTLLDFLDDYKKVIKAEDK